MLPHPDFSYTTIETYNWENLQNIYVRRWCIYNLFIELSKRVSNNQHLILDLHKENTVSQKKKHQGIFQHLC